MKTIRIKGTLYAILKTKDDKEVTTSHFTYSFLGLPLCAKRCN